MRRGLRLPRQRRVLEAEILVVQDVAELVALDPQVVEVVLLRAEPRSAPSSVTVQADGLEPDDLARVVGEQADGGEAEVGEDLGSDAVVAQVGREAELEVGLDRVEAAAPAARRRAAC